MARARPLPRLSDCAVAGCAREHVSVRGLCRFHDNRFRRHHDVATVSAAELAGWIAAQQPRLGVAQFSLAGLPELVRYELLYGLQRRDEAPPPLEPTQVRILISRLTGAHSLRDADPQAVCESGGVQYNDSIKGLSPTCAGTWIEPGPNTAVPTRSRATPAGGPARPAVKRLAPLAGHQGSRRLHHHRGALAA